jgi:hypothetical protein
MVMVEFIATSRQKQKLSIGRARRFVADWRARLIVAARPESRFLNSINLGIFSQSSLVIKIITFKPSKHIQSWFRGHFWTK